MGELDPGKARARMGSSGKGSDRSGCRRGAGAAVAPLWYPSPAVSRKNRHAVAKPPLRAAANTGWSADWSANWSDARWASALGLLAALLRVLFVLSGTDRSWAYSVFYEGDSETFFRFARALLAGDLYDGGIPFHPPGFAFFLAGLQLVSARV